MQDMIDHHGMARSPTQLCDPCLLFATQGSCFPAHLGLAGVGRDQLSVPCGPLVCVVLGGLPLGHGSSGSGSSVPHESF